MKLMVHMGPREGGCPSEGPLCPGAERDLTHGLGKHLYLLYLFYIYLSFISILYLLYHLYLLYLFYIYLSFISILSFHFLPMCSF